MNVVFLGTAAWMGDGKTHNAGTSILVYRQFGKKRETILIEAPPDVGRSLSREGIHPNTIARIIVSHFHPDHVEGLHHLVGEMYLRKRRTPLQIMGPKGIKTVFRALCRCNKTFRAHYERLPFQVSFSEMRGTGECEGIAWIPAAHAPPACSLAIFEKDKKLVYTGDTMLTRALETFAARATLLISECSYPSKKRGHMGVRDTLTLYTRARPLLMRTVHFYPCFRQFPSSAAYDGETLTV